MMQLQQVSKIFNAGQVTEVKALSKVNLSINDGDFLVVVGANGSGKSTLLSVMSGQTLCSSGKISIGTQDVTQLPDYRRSRWISRVFQDPLSGTAANLSILENFRLASLRTGRKSLHVGTTKTFEKIVQEKISMLGMGLENKIHQPIGTLSGGQRQALTLLMCTMDELSVLLLDEPTSALDPRSAASVMQTADHIIRENRLTAVLVTHNMKEACQYGNRIIQMANGTQVRDLGSEAKSQLKEQDIYQWFL